MYENLLDQKMPSEPQLIFHETFVLYGIPRLVVQDHTDFLGANPVTTDRDNNTAIFRYHYHGNELRKIGLCAGSMASSDAQVDFGLTI